MNLKKSRAQLFALRRMQSAIEPHVNLDRPHPRPLHMNVLMERLEQQRAPTVIATPVTPSPALPAPTGKRAKGAGMRKTMAGMMDNVMVPPTILRPQFYLGGDIEKKRRYEGYDI